MLDAIGDHSIHVISQRHVHGHPVFLLHRLTKVHHSTRNARDHLGKVLADLLQPAFPLDLLLGGCDMLDLLHDEFSLVFKLLSGTTSALMTLRHALQLRRQDVQLIFTAGARLSLQLHSGLQPLHLLLQMSNAKIRLSAVHLRYGPLLPFCLEALLQILHLLALATGEALRLFLCLSKLLPLLLREWHLGSLSPQGLQLLFQLLHAQLQLIRLLRQLPLSFSIQLFVMAGFLLPPLQRLKLTAGLKLIRTQLLQVALGALEALFGVADCQLHLGPLLFSLHHLLLRVLPLHLGFIHFCSQILDVRSNLLNLGLSAADPEEHKLGLQLLPFCVHVAIPLSLLLLLGHSLFFAEGISLPGVEIPCYILSLGLVRSQLLILRSQSDRA
mmetsp:Transcript_53297/g.84987  ORF Transcript_53297/g.84987 Transcript_53297/m.84987 type:complete len:385 (+) Transcript_53297:1671-2825(+)